VLAAACFALAVAAAASAEAAPDDAAARKQAIKLGGEALDLFAAGDYQAALEKFQKADELVPAPTLKLHVARCLDKLDRMMEAADEYREIIATELPAIAPKVHKEARKSSVTELATLLEQTPSVRVVVEGPGAEQADILLEGVELPAEVRGEKQSLDPGHYRFEAKIGYRRAAREIDLERGQHERVVLRLPARKAKAPPPVASDDGDWMRIAGWVAIGVGGAALSWASITGVAVLSEEGDLEARCVDRQCPPDAHDDARAFDRLRAATTAGLVIGGVGVAAGTTLLLLMPGESAGDRAELRLRVGFGSVGVAGSF
jgi:tetratricopeptide (TPR) repeat protein